MKRLSITLCVLFLMVSCQKEESSIYPYVDGFRSYMQSHHQQSLDAIEDNIYVVVGVDGCEPCIENLLTILARPSNKENIIPIFVGTAQQDHIKKLESEARANYTQVLQDSKGVIGSYATGFGYPIMVHIKDGKAHKYIDVMADHLEEFEQYLLK